MIAILAILAGVVVFAVGSSTDNAKVSSCKTEKSAAKTAIAAAKAANEVNVSASYEAPYSYLENAGSNKYYSVVSGANTAAGTSWSVASMSGAPC